MGKKYYSWAEWSKNTGAVPGFAQNTGSLPNPYKFDPGDGYAGTVPEYQEEFYTLPSVDEVIQEALAQLPALLKSTYK